ncbi:hypothetical protein C172_27663 [Paenibacillus sp. FSL H8-457]|nr:hypothetical protein C172_27663 [Paenibacillus sp. FSL H8-457]
MGAAVVQMEFYESVTEEERTAAKMLLRRYIRMRKIVDELGACDVLNEKQQIIYEDWKFKTENIERAIRVIVDMELRAMMEYRFMKGNPRKAAVIRWNRIHERTFDRRIVDGVESVASTLKLWGVV